MDRSRLRKKFFIQFIYFILRSLNQQNSSLEYGSKLQFAKKIELTDFIRLCLNPKDEVLVQST